MKILAWTAALALASLSRASVRASDIRVCPDDSFFYAGDDTKPSIMGRSYWLEEVDRSPTYSCYSLLRQVRGFSAALAECRDRESSLVAFEDRSEVERVLASLGFGTDNVTFATSGMHFADIDRWMWLGTKNYSTNPLPLPVTSNNVSVEQCLRVSGGSRNGTASFVSFRCNDVIDYMCEARVQTVTYIAWFYTNWLTLLLSITVVLMMAAMCVSLFYSKPRLYRARARSQRMAQQSSLSSHFTLDDVPPPYKDVAGNQSVGGKLDKYRNKGKEILSKVTYYNYKESPSKTSA